MTASVWCGSLSSSCRRQHHRGGKTFACDNSCQCCGLFAHDYKLRLKLPSRRHTQRSFLLDDVDDDRTTTMNHTKRTPSSCAWDTARDNATAMAWRYEGMNSGKVCNHIFIPFFALLTASFAVSSCSSSCASRRRRLLRPPQPTSSLVDHHGMCAHNATRHPQPIFVFALTPSIALIRLIQSPYLPRSLVPFSLTAFVVYSMLY